jgi:uncharacterized protein YuzB (UPF0349 family)
MGSGEPQADAIGYGVAAFLQLCAERIWLLLGGALIAGDQA